MMRVVLLSLAGAIVFAGFAAPFFVAGTSGIYTGGALIIFGAVALAVVARKTRKSLDADNAWNRTMKADGETLVQRDKEQ